MGEDKIDFVVTWVDGNDPAWLAEKSKYSPNGADARNARYRDWDQLKYWFRAIEKNAPWVNKIHFVTYGHLPKWLDTSNPKLHIVRHEDFIPKEYLPVFNSTAIEVHINKIPGLAEQFVYFNDDTYLMKPCKPTDFFRKGKPVDMLTLGQFPVNRVDEGEMYYCHLYNNYSVYRNYSRKKDALRHFWKYMSPKYGRVAFSNFLNFFAKNLYIAPYHFGIPLLKSSMETIWTDHTAFMTMTAASRFRSPINVNLQCIRSYQLITGNFIPAKKSGVALDSSDPKTTKAVIESKKYRDLCISDNSRDDRFEDDKKEINESFERIFPGKCSFEL